jgi:iron(II)-dependent oxidoreductase
MALKLFSKPRAKRNNKRVPTPIPESPKRRAYEPVPPLELDPDPGRLMVQLGQYGRILAGQTPAAHPQTASLKQAAMDAIDQGFALVPEGCVSLPQTISDYPGCPELDIETPAFLLAKHAVTNEQFYRFVSAGGYENLSLWPEDIWPHLIDFKDFSGRPGPRYWREGAPDRARLDHPVVGICFYEAAAFACWAGMRLPDEAEWQMAASWRIRSTAHVLHRYPWGDAFDLSRCNLWGSGVGDTVPVSAYEEGASPNGVLQLVGNTWEWTSADFEVTDDEGNPVVGDMVLKSVRGGAYDTYFPAQATSCYRTGLPTLMRAHNVSFRCALAADAVP